MAIAKNNDRIGLTVSKEFKAELQKLADKDGRPLSNFVVKILTDYVEQVKKQNSQPK